MALFPCKRDSGKPQSAPVTQRGNAFYCGLHFIKNRTARKSYPIFLFSFHAFKDPFRAAVFKVLSATFSPLCGDPEAILYALGGAF